MMRDGRCPNGFRMTPQFIVLSNVDNRHYVKEFFPFNFAFLFCSLARFILNIIMNNMDLDQQNCL